MLRLFFFLCFVLFPVVLGAQVSSGLLAPSDFTYKGAFRLPHGAQAGGSSFVFSGRVGCIGPNGNTLYLGGNFSVPTEDTVAEVSIPEPVVSVTERWQDLPVAQIVTPFTDQTADRRSATGIPYSNNDSWGLLVEGDELFWTFWQFYNVTPEDHPFFGRAPLLNVPARVGDGPWWVGSQPLWRSQGSLFRIPQAFADAYFGGRNIGCGGRQEGTPGNVSHGPSCFVFNAPANGTMANSRGNALELMFYPSSSPSPGFGNCDSWQSAAWLEYNGKSALLFFGRKGLPSFRYGEQIVGQNCMGAKGYHCDRMDLGQYYHQEMIFIDPQELVKVADGVQSSSQVAFYERWNLRETSGFWKSGSGSCYGRAGALAWDQARGRLYLVQPGAYNTDASTPYPIVHRWDLSNVVTPPPPPVVTCETKLSNSEALRAQLEQSLAAAQAEIVALQDSLVISQQALAQAQARNSMLESVLVQLQAIIMEVLR